MTETNDTGPAEQAPDRNASTDSRVQRSKTHVINVTLELLAESGVSGISVDDVARRSGVAKTTIYRHWPTRTDLILDACSQISTRHEAPDTGNFEQDITTLLTSMAQMLSTARWSFVMPSILDAAERDPNLADIHRRIQSGHTAPFEEVITRAKCSGQLPATTDSSSLVAALLGPLYYHRWFSRETLDEKFVRGVIEMALRHLMSASKKRASSRR